MPDFQLSEDPPAPDAPTPASGENPAPAPPKTSGFSLLDDAPTANVPAAPQQPLPTPPKSAAPAPLAPKMAPPAVGTPAAGIPVPNVPVPTVPAPATPPPAAPTSANAPAATNPNAPPPARPLVPRPAGTPAAGAASSNAATPSAAPSIAARPMAVPIAVPIPSASTRSAISDEMDGAPQDATSRKMWEFGQTIKRGLDVIADPAIWILRLAALIGGCALAYMLAATLLGKAGDPGNPQMATLTKNLDLASKGFVFSLLAAAVCSLLLGYEDNRLGAIVCAVGVLFHFGMPIALKSFVGVSPATSIMATHFRQGGFVLVLVGLVKAVGDTAVWLWGLPDRMKTLHANVGVASQAEAKQRIIAREANMMSPCWKLPFCRESIRKQCPAFLAKKTCWKFGRGCYCDTEMISRIVRGESLELIKAPTQQSRQGKPPCGRCYIYLEHQTYKFRVLSPLALPLAVATTWLGWPLYTKIFSLGDKAFNSIWTSLSFDSTKLVSGDMASSEEAVKRARELGNSAESIAAIAQNMFGFLLGFMLLIYISKFIEWAIYKAKW